MNEQRGKCNIRTDKGLCSVFQMPCLQVCDETCTSLQNVYVKGYDVGYHAGQRIGYREGYEAGEVRGISLSHRDL